MIGKTIHELAVGEAAEFAKTVSESDVYLFAGVTGDLNPAHINEEYASRTFFKTRIAHGMLAAGMVSAVLGCRLPGPGTVYLRQEMSFLAPVRIGDTVTARVEVLALDLAKNQATLKTECAVRGRPVLTGTAVVSPPKPLKPPA